MVETVILPFAMAFVMAMILVVVIRQNRLEKKLRGPCNERPLERGQKRRSMICLTGQD